MYEQPPILQIVLSWWCELDILLVTRRERHSAVARVIVCLQHARHDLTISAKPL